MPEATSERDVLITAGRALGRVDLYGQRGLTLLSLDEIKAMALALVILGLVAIPPHQITPPERLTVERN